MANEERFLYAETRTFTTNDNEISQDFSEISFENRGGASANVVFFASDANEPSERRTVTIQAGQILTLTRENRGYRTLTVNASGTTLDVLLIK